jgi:hypothetical protein
MKGTLRKVNEGIVSTIDERPKEGDYCYDSGLVFGPYEFGDISVSTEGFKIILASTFGVGLELRINIDQSNNYASAIGWDRYVQEKLNTEYSYTIQDNKVIIEL